VCFYRCRRNGSDGDHRSLAAKKHCRPVYFLISSEQPDAKRWLFSGNSETIFVSAAVEKMTAIRQFLVLNVLLLVAHPQLDFLDSDGGFDYCFDLAPIAPWEFGVRYWSHGTHSLSEPADAVERQLQNF